MKMDIITAPFLKRLQLFQRTVVDKHYSDTSIIHWKHITQSKIMKQNLKKDKKFKHHNSKELGKSVVACIRMSITFNRCGYVHGDVISTFAASN